MIDILSIIPGKKRTSASGWTSFNCICCIHRGHKPDQRFRGGIKNTDAGGWVYNCFNCNYRCSFVPGDSISVKTRQLLAWCGVEPEQIQQWNLESIGLRWEMDTTGAPKFLKHLANNQRKPVTFNPTELPEGAVPLDATNPEHEEWVKYIQSRGMLATDYNFMVTPAGLGRNRNRIIIPYTHHGVTVGYTSRYCDGRTPKYVNNQQPGYVFGFDFQQPEWNVVLVMEGIFDALSVRGMAVMHNTISPEQRQIINSLNRRVIVVPDHNKAGIDIIEPALQFGWSVSLPSWGDSVVDVNDAVIRYGRVPTLLSILQNATTNKIKIDMQRRKLGVK